MLQPWPNPAVEIEWSIAAGAVGAVLGHIVGDLAGFLIGDRAVQKAHDAASLQAPFEGWETFTDQQWDDFDALMQARQRQSNWRRYAGAAAGGVGAGLAAAHLAPTRVSTRVGVLSGLFGAAGYAIPGATRFWGPGFAAVGAYLGSLGGRSR